MIHLVKLCVGISSVDSLAALGDRRLARGRDTYGEDVHVHRTRTMPRRAAEIDGAGSLYWVVAGRIACRQSIVRLVRAVDAEGRKCCDILMAPRLVRTVPRPRAAFQGWRYLEAADAPPDLPSGADGDELPERMAAVLSELGLL